MKKLITSMILIAFLFVTSFSISAETDFYQPTDTSSESFTQNYADNNLPTESNSVTESNAEISNENNNENIESNQNITTFAATAGISSGTVYNIKNVGSGKYLNVHNGVDANGTNVYQWTGDGSTEQKFKVVYSSATDSYKFYAMCSSNGSNRVLDIVRNGAPLAHGQNVDIWTPVDATAQNWDIYLDENGYFRISPASNINICLSAIGTSNGTSGGTSATSSGNVIVATQTRGATGQNWIFEPVGGGTTAATPTGWLDSVSSSSISGWAWRSDIPNTSIDVHIYITNTATNQQWGYAVTANQYRQDLANAGYGNGYHGFNYAVNWANYPAGNYSVVAYAIGYNGNNPALQGCPKNYSNVIVNTFRNSVEETCFWMVPMDAGDVGIIVPVSNRVESVGMATTNTFASRTLVQISSFGKTVKNPNPEFNLPDMSIGNTLINNSIITTQLDTNVWVSPDWIWANETGYPNITVPNNSEFKTTVICMLDGSLYPYQSVTNTFNF